MYSLAHIISTGGFYGAERVVVELLAFLAANGHDGQLLILDSPGATKLSAVAVQHGLRVTRLPGGGRSSVAAVGRYARERKLQLLHSHGYKSDIVTALARLPRGTQRVATAHSWYSANAKLRVYEKLDKLCLRRFAHVVGVAPEIVDELQRAGIAPQRTSMIANGLAARPAGDADNRARVRQEFGLHADAKLLVRIGRLDYYKGNQILLPALAACDTDAHLLLVGDGPERHALETQARELGLNGRVICTGYRDDVGELLGAADLFVISSLQEGLPMVLLEAMAARVPVISTNVGAIHTVIRPGANGWLVAPGEVAPLGDALKQALREPETARIYAAQAHADYLARYSRETMGRQYLALYEKLLAPDAAPKIAESPQPNINH